MKQETKHFNPTLAVILISAVVVIAMFYSTMKSPVEKLFVIMLGLFILIPFVLTLFTNVVDTAVKSIKQMDDNNIYSRKVDKNGRLILKSELKGNKKEDNASKKYTKKQVDTKGYEELKNMIIATSKHGLLERKTILDFKVEIRNILGTHIECYNNFKFENDMHFIYTTIKSSKLKEEDYNYLIEWLGTNLNLERAVADS